MHICQSYINEMCKNSAKNEKKKHLLLTICIYFVLKSSFSKHIYSNCLELA